jgi:hypothetical protein
MDRALQTADSPFRALAASVHWRVGRTLLAAQRLAEGLEHLRKGSQADPHGHFGRMARLELQQHGAQGD